MIFKKINILIIFLIVGLIAQAVVVPVADAGYGSSGTATSVNLLYGTSASSITNFHYDISALPGDSSVSIQFSTDDSTWYSAAGVLNASTQLTTIGGADLSLAALNWSGSSFYYKITLNATSDLTQTPAIDDIRLDYTPASGYGNMFVVGDNGNTGLGDSNPSARLSVVGNAAIGYLSGQNAPNNGLIVNGNVGIGTISPTAKLQVNGSLCVSAGTCAGDTTTGTIYADNVTVTSADLAENYPTTDSSLEAGDIVAANPNNAGYIIKASAPSSVEEGAGGGETNNAVLGIISTSPGFVLGTASTSKPVALAGRVPVKVSVENGPIAIGDSLTLSSSTPGVAMKYTPPTSAADFGEAKGEVIIGTALQAASSNGLISVFVRTGLSQSLSSGISTSTIGDTALGSESIMDALNAAVASSLQWIGERVVAAEGYFMHLTVGSANKPEGITLYDSSGNPGCITLSNANTGTIKATPGACDTQTQSSAATPATISSSTPSSGGGDVAASTTPNLGGDSTTTQQQAASAPETAATSTPNSTVETDATSTPQAAPSASPTPTATPDISPTPTDTPAPDPSSSPSATPTPTPTIAPSPSSVPTPTDTPVSTNSPAS